MERALFDDSSVKGTEFSMRGTSRRVRCGLVSIAVGFSTAALAAAWPARVYEFGLQQSPEIYQVDDFEISVTASRSTDAEEAADIVTGTRHAEFQITDLKTGRVYGFAAEAVGAAVLGTREFYPAIEVWSPVGGARFARCVFRKINRTYCCMVQEEFVATKTPATGDAFTRPGSAETMRFMGSRANQCEMK
jgi:hypothetical protein